MDVALEVRGLCLKFSGRSILDNISFTLRRGEVLAVMGDSRSGKSSLLKVCCGIWPATAGEIFAFGLVVGDDGLRVRERIGFAQGDARSYSDLTVIESFVAQGSLHGLSRAQSEIRGSDLIRRWGLEDISDRPILWLAPLQQRQIEFLRALVSEPQLVIVDDLARDLDPQARGSLARWLTAHRPSDLTMLMATSGVDEAEGIANWAMILGRGEVICQGQPEKLIREHIGREVVECEVDPGDLDYFIRHLGAAARFQVLGSRLRIFVNEPQSAREILKDIPIRQGMVRPAHLEDVFAKVTQTGRQSEGGLR